MKKTELRGFVILISVSIIASVIISLLAVKWYHTILTPKFPEFEMQPEIDTRNVAYNCYQKPEYVDCYIIESTYGKDGIIIGGSNITHFYRCYNDIKRCILIEKYYRETTGC